MSDVTIVKEGWVQKRGKCSTNPKVTWWVSVRTVSDVLAVDIFPDAVNKVNCDRLCPVREMIFNMCVRNLLAF